MANKQIQTSVGSRLQRSLLLAAVVSLAASQTQAGALSCDTLIDRVGLSGGLQVRVGMEELSPLRQQTASRIEAASADDLSGLMAELGAVIWPQDQQNRTQWAYSDVHTDSAGLWVSLRLRPQASQLNWPSGCPSALLGNR